MDKSKARLVVFFTFVIWLVSCSRIPALTTIPITNSPDTTPSASRTKQVSTLWPTQTPTQTPTSMPSQTPTPAPTGKVVVWAPLRIIDILNKPSLIDAFTKRYPGIDLQWVVKDSPQIENDILRPGEKSQNVDVVFLEGDQAASVAASGVLSEINSSNPGIDNPEIPISSTDISFENRVFALALYEEPIVVYFRRDVFAKAGLATNPSEVSKLIPTWQSLLSVCQIIRAKTGYPCLDLNRANNSGDLFEVMLQTQNSAYFDKSEKLRISPEEFTSVLSDLSIFWKAGVVGDELAWTPAWLDHLASVDNPVALVFGTPELGKALETWIAPIQGVRWGITTIPSYKHDPPVGARGPGGYLAIMSRSTNQAASLEVIRFFTRDPSAQNALLDQKEYFPAYINPSDISKLGQPDPFFAGQVPADVFFNSSDFPEWSLFGPDYQKIHGLVEEAVRRVAIGRMQPEAASKQFFEKILASTPEP